MTTSGVKDKQERQRHGPHHDDGPEVADTVAGVAGEAGARLPDAASTTRRRVPGGEPAGPGRLRRDAQGRRCIGGRLRGGLLFGGANRLLVIAALVPAVVTGATLVERMASRFLADEGRVRGLIARGSPRTTGRKRAAP